MDSGLGASRTLSAPDLAIMSNSTGMLSPPEPPPTSAPGTAEADRIAIAPSPLLAPRHGEVRRRARDFALTEIAPFAQEWDEAETFPDDLFRKAAAAGVLGAGFPVEYGGAGGDIFDKIIVKEELARFGSGGVRASLLSLGIGLPPILALGTDEQKERVARPVLAGEKVSALAITEPEGGSDVASLRTCAKRDGDAFVVGGRKTLITSGMRADFYTVAVRTGGEGRQGISLLLIEKGTPGFTQTRLKKMGWWASDTATLTFEDCRVPVGNLIGSENDGFRGIMHNFNEERLGNTAIVLGAAKACYDETVAYARSRHAFGRALMANQVVRHKLVDMATQIQAVEALLHLLAYQYGRGEKPAAQIAMLKNLATDAYEFCASEAVQVHGGAGILRSGRVERLFRESKILSIGGGSVEILKDLVGRQLGY